MEKLVCLPFPLEVTESLVGLDDTKIEDYPLVLGKIEIPHSMQIKKGTADDPFKVFQRWTTTTTVLSLDTLRNPATEMASLWYQGFKKPGFRRRISRYWRMLICLAMGAAFLKTLTTSSTV